MVVSRVNEALVDASVNTYKTGKFSRPLKTIPVLCPIINGIKTLCAFLYISRRSSTATIRS